VLVVAVSGSLQAASSNTSLLRALAAGDGPHEIRVWDGLGQLPHFSPDAVPDEAVESLRKAVSEADAVLLATPEYAGGMPGSLKNALDWLVGTGELYGKRAVVLSAAPSAERGHNARRWLEEVLPMQGATVLASFTVPVRAADGPGAIDADAADVLARILAILTE